MSVHVSSRPADEASRLPATAWLILGIVLVADIMDLLTPPSPRRPSAPRCPAARA
jgi:hypothetical protein